MHIYLNMSLTSSWTGGVIYIQNLARAIASLPAKERAEVKLSIGVNSAISNLAEPVHHYVDRIHSRKFLDRAYLKICNVIAERITFVPLEALNPYKIDFAYPTIAGSRTPYQWGGWIPDFQHYHLPELFSPEEIAARDAQQQTIARSASVVVLSSQMAQQDFCHLYPEAASRSVVMQFASSLDPEFFQPNPKLVQEKYELPDNFFLVSNQFWKHKDHLVVIKALGLLKQQNIHPTVVCTGSTQDHRHPDCFERFTAEIEALGLKDRVRILGLIPRLDQIQLMRRCLAVIQPSLFEGWSTVVEDARLLGKPLLLSDFPVHLEQNPKSAHFFERGNPEQLATLISKALFTLQPGPDLEIESIAKQENAQRVVAYGRRFLEIASSVASRK